MQKAAEIFEGFHDFAAFCAAGSSVESTERNLYSLDLYPADNGEIWIDVEGDGFLYNMIRILVGTLIEAGTGKRTLSELKEILQSCNRECGFYCSGKGFNINRSIL